MASNAMSDQPPQIQCFSEACRRAAARARPVHGVALVSVVVAAFGLVGLRSFELPGPAPISDGERMRIEVVAPIEPKVSPGSVMEVGDLVNGLTEIPRPAPPEPIPASYAYVDEDWDADLAPAPPRRRYDEAPVVYSAPQPEARPDRGDRWFGFDLPRRDYQAERDARRVRMDALERREQDRERERRDVASDRWREPPPPPPPDADWR